MNKKEAADYLGVSTRAIERYTSKGRLTPKYEPGRTGPAPVYDQAQLDELKKEMGDTPHARPAPAKHDNDDKSDKPAKSDALMRRPAQVENFAALIAALDKGRTPSISDLSNKLILKLDEAAQLTGLSRGILREAIETGKLKARIIGRAWRIKRADLDSYVMKL
jgi:excisionase family DNA binding protein